MRTYGPDDEPDDLKIDWIEAGIFRTCQLIQMTRKELGLCSRLEVDVVIWVQVHASFEGAVSQTLRLKAGLGFPAVVTHRGCGERQP